MLDSLYGFRFATGSYRLWVADLTDVSTWYGQRMLGWRVAATMAARWSSARSSTPSGPASKMAY